MGVVKGMALKWGILLALSLIARKVKKKDFHK